MSLSRPSVDAATWVAVRLRPEEMISTSSVWCGVTKSYWTRDFNKDLGHPNKGFVKVFDGLYGILRRLVADIANATVRKELDVGHRKFGEVFAHIILRELGRHSSHKNTRRLHI